MGTGGLNVKKLRGLLERRKVTLELLQGDAARDGCLLKISSLRAPGIEGLLEYENWGEEPRHVELTFFESGKIGFDRDPNRASDASIELSGARAEDPAKIADWLEREYLGRTAAPAVGDHPATSLLD